MVVCGVVSNVLDFGAFINIGVGNQLLLHRTDMIAKDGNARVSDPLQCVELGQILTLVVKDKDPKSTNTKLTLSMKGVPEGKPANLSDQPDVEFKEEIGESVQDDYAHEVQPAKPTRSTKRKATEETPEEEPQPKRRKVSAKDVTENNEDQTDVKRSRSKSTAKTNEEKIEPNQIQEEVKPKRGRKKAVEKVKEEDKPTEQAVVDKPKRGRPKKSDK